MYINLKKTKDKRINRTHIVYEDILDIQSIEV